MSKAPSDQVYWADILRDVELQNANATARGIWVANALPRMWFATPQGQLSGTIEQLTRTLNATPDEMVTFLSQIKTHKFGDIYTAKNGIVTLTNRRMYNKYLSREKARLRKQRSREGHKDVTAHTSTALIKPARNTNVTPAAADQKVVESADMYLDRIAEYFDNIPQADILKWAELYENVDIMREIPIARNWLETKVQSRYKLFKAFLNNWLKNENKSLRSAAGKSEGRSGTVAGFISIAQEEGVNDA